MEKQPNKNNNAVKKSRAKKKKLLDDMKVRKENLEGMRFSPYQPPLHPFSEELVNLQHENQVCDNDISMLEQLNQKDPSELTQEEINYLNEQLSQLN